MDWIKQVLVISILLVPMNISAESPYNFVVLETVEGKTIEFGLSSNPRLFQRNDTIIMTNDMKRIEIIMTDIKKIFFSLTNNGIKKVLSTAKGRIEVQGSCVFLSNFSPGEFVAIYNLSGQQLLKRVITSQGTLAIPFTDIPKGIVIVKTNNQFIKIKHQ